MSKRFVIVPKADAEADFCMLNAAGVTAYSDLRMNTAKNKYAFSIPKGPIPDCFLPYEVFKLKRMKKKMTNSAWRPTVPLLARIFRRKKNFSTGLA